MSLFDQYPKQRARVTGLGTSAQTLVTGPANIRGIQIRAGSSATEITFRAVADTPVYFIIDVTAGETTEWTIPFSVDDLEVLADAGTASQVTIFYV